ncbi:lipoprotein-releasing system ATP-binding protein [Trichlorobacter thiogenes]|uniref:Lipoprotein-releasing system ATP-binding protein n=1 Tax=Trichlorobacter thiogenes TaxID=115783 RepID=A0A1T4R425_9BACT|nr:ABC transporter ATP-binding protein [Trichlorobacter thiogenes]SKA10627.1 lipoprotein-releasing system ATP-binding protein [Trichlorobacter thiogenes]
MSSLLEVTGLCKDYRMGAETVQVLKGIDLAISSGTTTALVGASGAGKSTLLHILGALDRPSSGRVTYKGQDLFARSDRELADFRSSTIGFVFQFHHLLPEFTALENVMMPALIARKERRQAEQQARAILGDVGLEHRLLHRPGELSGGEQQRVAIARALILEPELLLADEPTGNLDAKTSEAIYELLVKIQKQTGISMVIVTHNERIAARMERVVRLLDGLILPCTTEEV